jgi:hypothetical protein
LIGIAAGNCLNRANWPVKLAAIPDVGLDTPLSPQESPMIRASLAAVLVAAFSLPAWIAPVVAQPKGDAKIQAKAKKAVAKGRLPTYYAQIVTEDQRQRIYQIQASYDAKIDELQAELDALVGQRDAEIRDVLSPVQQRRLDARIADAQAKRAAKAEKKAAEKKRNVVPVKKAG